MPGPRHKPEELAAAKQRMKESRKRPFRQLENLQVKTIPGGTKVAVPQGGTVPIPKATLAKRVASANDVLAEMNAENQALTEAIADVTVIRDDSQAVLDQIDE